MEAVKREEGEEEMEETIGGIVLDSTAEFCRTLGDIPTYGQAGNRDVGAQELMEMEEAATEEDGVGKEGGAWSSVDPQLEHIPVDINRGEQWHNLIMYLFLYENVSHEPLVQIIINL